MKPFNKKSLQVLRHGLTLVFLASFCLTDAMAASDKDSKERKALQQMRGQLSEAQKQKSVLEQEKSELTGQLDEIKRKSTDLASDAAKANARGVALEKEVESLNKAKADLGGKLQETTKGLQEMTKQQAETKQTLQHKEHEIKRLEADVARQTRQIEMCETKNVGMYRLNVELMDKYQSDVQAEPFIGLKRVDAENMLQDYRDKLDVEKTPSASQRTERPKQ